METNVQNGKPCLSEDDVRHLLREKYNINCSMVKEEECYENQVFIIDSNTTVATSNLNWCSSKFVLKVMNTEYSRNYDRIYINACMMNYLHRRGFGCPYVIPQLEGNEIGQLRELVRNVQDCKDDETMESLHLFQLMTFLPGKPLDKMEKVQEIVFEKLGELLGEIHCCLMNFEADLSCYKGDQEVFIWALENAPSTRRHAHYIQDIKKRQLVLDVLHDFENRVLVVKDELRSGFIHGDINDTNTLLPPQYLKKSENINTGDDALQFIDFDDACYAPYIFDVGVTMTYVMLTNTDDPLQAAGIFLRHYETVNKLTTTEVDLLYYCITARFAQSLLNGLNWYHSTGDCLALQTQKKGWTVLEQISKKDWKQLYLKWNTSRKTKTPA